MVSGTSAYNNTVRTLVQLFVYLALVSDHDGNIALQTETVVVGQLLDGRITDNATKESCYKFIYAKISIVVCFITCDYKVDVSDSLYMSHNCPQIHKKNMN